VQRRIAPQTAQVVRRIVGMLDMPVSTDVTHIACFVQDQGPVAEIAIKNARFNFEAQRRGRLERFHEYGARQMLEAAAR